MQTIVDWLVERETDDGMNFYGGKSWTRVRYEVLAERSMGAAALLHDLGVRRGDRVALILPTSEAFAYFFFGAVALGAVPTPMAPAGLQGSVSHVDYVASLLGVLSPKAVVAESATLVPIREKLGTASPVVLVDADTPLPDGSDVVLDPARGEELAIIQFTSGSSSSPRGARLSMRAILAHIDMLKSVFHSEGAHTEQTFGSWLPLHHDMGLIGTFLTPVTYAQEVWLMRPEHFVRRPSTWLELFGSRGVQHSAMPNFAVERITRLVSQKALEGMDFSTWRTLIVGSDRINFDALRSFVELLSPFGFRPSTIKPGYGMAETTLAISTTAPNEIPTAVTLEELGTTGVTRAAIVHERDVLAPDLETALEDVSDRVDVVSCGAELPGARISVVDEERNDLPDGSIGELVVRSPALFSGYVDEDRDEAAWAADPHHFTGDLGFRHRGQIYILGRIGNTVKVNGTFVTAEDIEFALAERLGVHHDRITVVLKDMGQTGSAASLVIYQQRIDDAKVEVTRGVLDRAGLGSDRAAVMVLPPLAIPRTTSGKPKRAHLWNQLELDKSGARVAFVGSSSPFAVYAAESESHEPVHG